MSLGSGIRDPGTGKNLFRIPDHGVKKAPDPGSATLHKIVTILKFFLFTKCVCTQYTYFIRLTQKILLQLALSL
jgi:hypothetical protein